MTPAEADSFSDAGAAYVHIPFCSAICPYCDFAVVAGQDEMADRYIDAVLAEIDRSAPWRPLQAVYFGGGTPSHVAPHLLGAIIQRLQNHHGLAPGAEISLEANPEDFTTDKASQFLGLGFNRVSFGAQSFDESVLGDLGRRHRSRDIENSVNAARTAGFGNLSVDLIYGNPGETDESWLGSLGRTVDLGVDHVSAYALTVERGTPLGREVAAGAAAPDPDIQADRYAMADEVLTGTGLERYEVSNWARPGHECRYNLTVWAQGEYEAYGNGAHGYRNGVRFRNHRRLEAYVTAIEEGTSPRAGEDAVAGWDAELDRIFVGLRRAVGVSSGPGTDALLASEEGKALIGAGIIDRTPDRLRVTDPLLTDAVHRSVLSQTGPIVVHDGDA
jgi:putative oxygen-independent coproporphyrinogen III oxidase